MRHSSETGFDGIETALKSRQTEIERLLKATEAAIARTLGCKNVNGMMIVIGRIGISH